MLLNSFDNRTLSVFKSQLPLLAIALLSIDKVVSNGKSLQVTKSFFVSHISYFARKG